MDFWIWDLTSEICNKNFLGSYRRFGVDWGVLYTPTACEVNADLSITCNFLVIHLPWKSHKHSTEEISRFKFFYTRLQCVKKFYGGLWDKSGSPCDTSWKKINLEFIAIIWSISIFHVSDPVISLYAKIVTLMFKIWQKSKIIPKPKYEQWFLILLIRFLDRKVFVSLVWIQMH